MEMHIKATDQLTMDYDLWLISGPGGPLDDEGEPIFDKDGVCPYCGQELDVRESCDSDREEMFCRKCRYVEA